MGGPRSENIYELLWKKKTQKKVIKIILFLGLWSPYTQHSTVSSPII